MGQPEPDRRRVRAAAPRSSDIDGNTYVDLCLGDTGAMAGHAPAPVVDGGRRRRWVAGATFMLPTEDAHVGR